MDYGINPLDNSASHYEKSLDESIEVLKDGREITFIDSAQLTASSLLERGKISFNYSKENSPPKKISINIGKKTPLFEQIKKLENQGGGDQKIVVKKLLSKYIQTLLDAHEMAASAVKKVSAQFAQGRCVKVSAEGGDLSGKIRRRKKARVSKEEKTIKEYLSDLGGLEKVDKIFNKVVCKSILDERQEVEMEGKVLQRGPKIEESVPQEIERKDLEVEERESHKLSQEKDLLERAKSLQNSQDLSSDIKELEEELQSLEKLPKEGEGLQAEERQEILSQVERCLSQAKKRLEYIKGKFVEGNSTSKASNVYEIGPIPNQGNTCFLASSLQMIAVYDSIREESGMGSLFSSDKLKEVPMFNKEKLVADEEFLEEEKLRPEIITARTQLKRELAGMIKNLKQGKGISGDGNLIRLEKLIKKANSSATGLIVGQQNCTREVFDHIMSSVCPPKEREVSMGYLTEYKPKKLEKVNEDQGIFALREEDKGIVPEGLADNMESCRIRKDPSLFVLDLPIIDEDREVSAEKLKENALGLEKMEGHKAVSRRSTFLDNPPKILPIDTKKAMFLGGGELYKRKGRGGLSEEFRIEPPYANKAVSYRLKSFVLHTGNEAKFGHYRAYIRNKKNQWISANDETIGPAEQEKFRRDLERNATFYLYERIEEGDIKNEER